MKKAITFCLLIFLLGMLKTAAIADSLEHQLAQINAGTYVSSSHITVARFRTLLGLLSDTYVESQQQISDMTVRAWQILRKERGVPANLLEMMEGMNRVLNVRMANQKYAEHMALYMGSRTNGMSHNEAIMGLQSLFGSSQ